MRDIIIRKTVALILAITGFGAILSPILKSEVLTIVLLASFIVILFGVLVYDILRN
jgi:ABC-type proline/glycine betaine transport system permease subunit